MNEGQLRRFLSKLEITDSCWLWTGSINRGYGQMYTGQRTTAGHKLPGKAHRLAYEHFVGPIPDGFPLDHLCHVRRCVNPDHLEVVSSKENAQRTSAHGRGTSPYRGVAFCKWTGRWRALVMVDGKQIHIGRYDDEREAARAAEEARQKLYGARYPRPRSAEDMPAAGGAEASK